MAKNITQFTGEMYDYFVYHKPGFPASSTNETYNILMAHIVLEGKMSQYVAYQMQLAWEDLVANHSDSFNKKEWKFVWVDDRHDESLVRTFGKRMYPHLWVVDKETNRSYSWDTKLNDINATTIKEWVLS